MQNIPGIALEKAKEQMQTVSFSAVKKSDQSALFAELFDEHAEKVENELALAPVSHEKQMFESAPKRDAEEVAVNAAGNEAVVEREPETPIHDNEQRMTQDEFDEVKDDLEKYGFSEEEINQIEEKVNSEEGMTWGEFVSEVAHKMAAMRNASMTDEQKGNLKTFFSKFGFTEKESDKLISHLEKGNFDKVMREMKAKIDAMPQDKPMLFEKKEIEAFTAALGFSKEFSAKVKELLGNNTLPKEVKEAFTMLRQEMANMDKKDEQLVRAVGKVFAKAMGDETKATSAARQIAEAVDLKPRVAEGKVKAETQAEAEVHEELAEAVKTRKDVMPDAKARRANEEALANKVEIKTDAKSDAKPEDATDAQDQESDENWNNFFGKLKDDGSQTAKQQTQAKTNSVESLSKSGLTEMEAKTKTQAWEKVSAPKVMKQVDNAIFKHLSNGTKQLTLQLTPENLGKLSIVLSVQGKEVGATIRAENPDAAKVIADNIDIIKNSLEAQGLKVEKLEVQTGLTGNQDYRDWNGEHEHNLSREREAMIAMRNHMKQMREQEGGLAQDLQLLREQAINADNGLHIIA